ncbi:hypothetical protein [Candidatus Harpocratesius sp.]
MNYNYLWNVCIIPADLIVALANPALVSATMLASYFNSTASDSGYIEIGIPNFYDGNGVSGDSKIWRQTVQETQIDLR